MTGKSIQSDLRAAIQEITDEHICIAKNSFTSNHLEILEKISREVIRALVAGHKLLLCGNGGSAADAQHIAAEFIARFKRERKSLPAIALTTDTSILTAVANDYDYESVFSRQIEGLGEKGDVLFALSTSGNSKNVLRAVETAKSIGMVSIGFTGATDGRLSSLTDICFCAQSNKTPHIQEIHITALHAISEVIEDTLFGS